MASTLNVEPIAEDVMSQGIVADTWGKLAADCIAAYVEAGNEYAALAGQEMDLEADRAGKKLDAIRRIMQGENPLTGKPHSASSAEAVVETDHEYRAHLKIQSDIVVMKNHSGTLAETARLRAELAIARFRVAGGLR